MARLFPGLALLVLSTLLLSSSVSCRRSAASQRHRSHPHHHHSNNDDPEDEEDLFSNEIEGEDEDEDRQLVLQHRLRVAEANKCEVPKVQVIHVKDHYPDKYYTPRCTLLHRCGKHAGCCAVDTLKCVAAEKEKVTLHFYSVTLDGNEALKPKIEKLVFTNHTRCGCAFPDRPHHHHHKLP